MESFLKTLLIVLLVYFALRFLFRLFGPYLMGLLAKRVARRFQNAFEQAGFDPNMGNPDPGPQKSAKRDTTKTNGKVVGEYIDFEEID